MTYTNNTIKSWAAEDRPREKLILKGTQALSTAELLAILIGSGSRDRTAVQLAKKILSFYANNLQELSKANIKDLRNFKGIGEAKAISIIAALELARRKQASKAKSLKKIESSNDAYEIIAPVVADLNLEEFWILLLNRNNRVIAEKQISSGGVSGTVVDPKVIFKVALDNLASAVILAHNHPSGNLKPSSQDINITKKLVTAGNAIEIKVLDHLIISQSGYFSFADEGLL